MNNNVFNEALALELAEKLNDTKGLPFYRKCTIWYEEDFLRDKLAIVLSMRNIRNKGAYFTTLISDHAKKPSRHWN